MVPLAFALLLAILLNPLTMLLEKWHFPKVLAISVPIILALIIIAAIAYAISKEIGSFSSELPVFKQKFAAMEARIQHMISQNFSINSKKQTEYISQTENSMKPLIGVAMGSALGAMAMVILLPVYTFLFLFYKKLLINFLYEVFAEENEKTLSVMLTQTKTAIQSYTFGLLIEALIVATLNTVALLLLGVKYAILLGSLGAILNVLPFIGGITAVLLPLIVATVTKDGFQTQLWIIVSYILIQFADNHFLIPYVVASKVRINALISIVIVLMGGALWGISGMFLSIPFIGVLKIIFDRLPELKPWGRLLGVEIATRKRIRRKLFP